MGLRLDSSVAAVWGAVATLVLPLYGLYCVIYLANPGGAVGFGGGEAVPGVLWFVIAGVAAMGCWSVVDQKRASESRGKKSS